MKAKLQNLNFLHVKWDFLALSGLAPSWLGVYFFLRLHAAAEKSDPFSLDIRGRTDRGEMGLLAMFTWMGSVRHIVPTTIRINKNKHLSMIGGGALAVPYLSTASGG